MPWRRRQTGLARAAEVSVGALRSAGDVARLKHSSDPSSMTHLDSDLFDAAIGKVATQSSISQWSQAGEAVNPISGDTFPDFAFHTDEEENPWWMLDLGAILPIEMIVIHNRVSMLQDRAARLRVEIAEGVEQWQLIHAGYSRFGGGDCGGPPLILNIGGDLPARYVRLSINGRQFLHLSKVEVLVRLSVVALLDFCSKYRIPVSPEGRNAPFKLVKNSQYSDIKIAGLKINSSRRFGNFLIQCVNAIQMVERTGLEYIQLGHHELFDLRSVKTISGITFIPYNQELPPVGIFMSGEFFYSGQMAPVLPPTLRYGFEEEVDVHRICKTYINSGLLTGLLTSADQKYNDELTIHLRAGDIFNCDDAVTSGYRQPPLSFYILVVERMRAAKRIDRVRLVFEDRGNPCIQALEEWLHANQILYRSQCASLQKDLSALVDAKHLVFGHGTFGYAACRLSNHIETVHFFAPQLGGSYEEIPCIEEVYVISDAGKYIKAYEYDKPFGIEDSFRRTPEMYQKMLTYPIDSLSIQRLR